jgi:hypothetical protein
LEKVTASVAVKRPTVLFPFAGIGGGSSVNQASFNLGDENGSQTTEKKSAGESLLGSSQPMSWGLSEETLFALGNAANRLGEAPAVDAAFDSLFAASMDFFSM